MPACSKECIHSIILPFLPFPFLCFASSALHFPVPLGKQASKQTSRACAMQTYTYAPISPRILTMISPWLLAVELQQKEFLAFVRGDDDDDDDDKKRRERESERENKISSRKTQNTKAAHPLCNTAWHELALHLDEIWTESRPSLRVSVSPNFVPELTHSNIHPFWTNSFPIQTQVGGSSVVRLSIRLSINRSAGF